MNTTLEIPDAVLRRAKANAAQKGIPLRQFVTEAVENKLRSESRGDGNGTTVQSSVPITVADEAEEFAREHRLRTSLELVKSFVLESNLPVLSIDVGLASDAEVPGQFTISFCIGTNAPLITVLDFDGSIHSLVYDRLPKDDQMYFAFRFEFA